MRYILLLIAASLLSLKGYSQTYRDINQGLAKGIECCQKSENLSFQVRFLDSIQEAQHKQINNLSNEVFLAKGSTELEEMKNISLQAQLETSGKELAREHRRKRTWRTLFFISTGALAGYAGYNYLIK